MRFEQQAGDTTTTAETSMPRVARDMRISKADLDTYGYTQNCLKCLHIVIHGQGTPATMNHSAQCRARLIEVIASTPEGQVRLD